MLFIFIHPGNQCGHSTLVGEFIFLRTTHLSFSMGLIIVFQLESADLRTFSLRVARSFASMFPSNLLLHIKKINGQVYWVQDHDLSLNQKQIIIAVCFFQSLTKPIYTHLRIQGRRLVFDGRGGWQGIKANPGEIFSMIEVKQMNKSLRFLSNLINFGLSDRLTW